MSRRLDIDALRALRTVESCGGITRAAELLSLSQSAVSHKIKRLEDNIGCTLLTRRAGAPLLTEQGERLLGYANRILSLHDEALQSLSTRSLGGKIRLGMTEDMTSSGLARILGRFTRLFPAISVRTRVEQSLTLQDELQNGTIDIAVMQVFADEVEVNDIVLYKDSLVWAKSVDMELDLSQPIPFLAYDDNCFYKTWLMDQGLIAGQEFEVVLQCSSNAGIIAGISSGLGVSIINSRHLSRDMIALSDGFPKPPMIAYVVRSSAKKVSQAVAALAGEIEREGAVTPALEAA